MGHILVTGGAGFIGSNLADRLAGLGHDVLVLDTLARPGVERNLDWLRRRQIHPTVSHREMDECTAHEARVGTRIGVW